MRAQDIQSFYRWDNPRVGDLVYNTRASAKNSCGRIVQLGPVVDKNGLTIQPYFRKVMVHWTRKANPITEHEACRLGDYLREYHELKAKLDSMAQKMSIASAYPELTPADIPVPVE